MLFMLHQMAMEHDKKVAQKQNNPLQPQRPPSEPPSPSTIGPLDCVVNYVKDSNVPIIWVLGGPGCGKGTQCDRMVQKYNFTHISTGDLLRAEVASGSEKGKELQEIMQKGELVANEEVLGLLEKNLIKMLKTSTGFIIDGYPREKDQGAAFEQYIAPVDLVLYFECSDDTMVQRIMKRAAEFAEYARPDDNEETIKTRLQTFKTNTEDILQQYTDKTKRIDGERTVDEIFNDVVVFVDEIIAAKKAPTVVAAAPGAALAAPAAAPAAPVAAAPAAAAVKK